MRRRMGPHIGVGRCNRLPVCRRSMTPAMMAVVAPAPGPSPRGRSTIVAVVWPSIIGANLRSDGPSQGAPLQLPLSGRIADVADDEAGPR